MKELAKFRVNDSSFYLRLSAKGQTKIRIVYLSTRFSLLHYIFIKYIFDTHISSTYYQSNIIFIDKHLLNGSTEISIKSLLQMFHAPNNNVYVNVSLVHSFLFLKSILLHLTTN